MKTYFAMMLLVAASSIGAVACVGAPEEGAESTAAPLKGTEAEGLKVNESEVGFISVAEAREEMHGSNEIAVCTAAQLAACKRQDPYGAGCMIRNGKVQCIFE